MNQAKKETLNVRILSVAFYVITLGVFKPFGLSAWQWEAYLHLLLIWVLGIIVCAVTECILKYIIRMPRSLDRGIGYIIRRNTCIPDSIHVSRSSNSYIRCSAANMIL